MPVPIRCGDSFTGRLEAFIDQYMSRMVLDEHTMSQAHASVVHALSQGGPLIVRGFGEHNQAGRVARSSDDAVSFVAGDNEPVVWFWRQNFHGHGPVDLVKLIAERDIPISMAPATGEDGAAWVRWGSGDATRVANRWRGAVGGRWKLCHIFQAAPRHLGSSGADIRARFIRNLHPINHFWFASEYKWRAHGAFEMTPHARLGEWPPLCLGVWEYFVSRYPREAKWFMENAGIDPSEMASTQRSPLEPFSFEWTNAPVATAAGEPSPRTDGQQFIVQENPNGRFHLTGFGAAVGGADRGQPFTFVVQDVDGRVLLSSHPQTAVELRIGADGREHYDANRYSNTDFVVRNSDDDVVPHSALGRRVKWAGAPE